MKKSFLSVCLTVAILMTAVCMFHTVNVSAVTEYKLIYDANGAQGTPPETRSYSRTTNIVVKNPSFLHKDGYHFAYWSEDRNGDYPIRVYSSDVIRLDKDITLYAIFKDGENVIDYMEDETYPDYYESVPSDDNSPDNTSNPSGETSHSSDSSHPSESHESSSDASSDTSKSSDTNTSKPSDNSSGTSDDGGSGFEIIHSDDYVPEPSDDGTVIIKKPVNPDNFIEWNTRKDGSGDGYQPGDKLRIDSDSKIVLYPIYDMVLTNTDKGVNDAKPSGSGNSGNTSSETSSEPKRVEHNSRTDDINQHLGDEYYYDEDSEVSLHEIENKQEANNISVTDAILPVFILLIFVVMCAATILIVSEKKHAKKESNDKK